MKVGAMYALFIAVLSVAITSVHANPTHHTGLLPSEQTQTVDEQTGHRNDDDDDDERARAWLAYQNSIVELTGLLGLSQQARSVAQQVLNEQQAALGLQYQVVNRIAQQWSPTQISEQLRQAFPDDHIDDWHALKQALQQPRMVRARALEQQAIQEQADEAYQQYVSRLRAQPPMQERLQLIAELDRSMHFSALMKRTRQGVYPHVQAVLVDWRPDENWSQQLQQQVYEFLLYVHRRTSNEELQALISEYRQAPLQQWLQAVQRQLSSAG